MSKGYKDGVGRHQRVFNMMRKKVPDIGYTGVCWVGCVYLHVPAVPGLHRT